MRLKKQHQQQQALKYEQKVTASKRVAIYHLSRFPSAMWAHVRACGSFFGSFPQFLCHTACGGFVHSRGGYFSLSDERLAGRERRNSPFATTVP